MKDILKVVITGGPCAGKTTAMKMLEEKLMERGNAVVFVDETATHLLKAKIRPFGDEKERIPLKVFQRLILKEQLAKEDIILEGASAIPNDNVIILFDRGALDNRAYLEDWEFDELMEEAGVTEEELLNRYDIVIHLVSTAIDKEECYENNEERKEPPEKARFLDVRTVGTWSKHPNHIVIFNDGTLEEKINLAANQIFNYQEQNSTPKIYQKK